MYEISRLLGIVSPHPCRADVVGALGRGPSLGYRSQGVADTTGAAQEVTSTSLQLILFMSGSHSEKAGETNL